MGPAARPRAVAAARRSPSFPCRGSVPTPYDRSSRGADETRYVSWADWICPTHCIEPALCPAIGAPRTWEMGDTVRDLAAQLRASGRPVADPRLFVCKHQCSGVGCLRRGQCLRAIAWWRRLALPATPAEILVGTISSCHGALNLLMLGQSSVTVVSLMTDNRRLMTAEERRRYLEHARDLFNRGDYWLAHEALETVWRSIIKEDEARVWQGFIQAAAAALLHRRAGTDTAPWSLEQRRSRSWPARSVQRSSSKRSNFARSWRAPWRGG